MLAGELKLPLFTIHLDAVITKFLGETASKLRQVFDAIGDSRGVYLFDEFDTIGSSRMVGNDVGEMRRALNSFLQLLEEDSGESIIVAATNHAAMLDDALFRRFDDAIEFDSPDSDLIAEAMANRLAAFSVGDTVLTRTAKLAAGLSFAEVIRACDDAAKDAILGNIPTITFEALAQAIGERR